MNALYGFSITDLGPYRAIRKQLLVELDMQEMTYGWPTEMTVKAARGMGQKSSRCQLAIGSANLDIQKSVEL